MFQEDKTLLGTQELNLKNKNTIRNTRIALKNAKTALETLE